MCKCAWLKRLFGIKKECCCHSHEQVATTPAPETPKAPEAPVMEQK